MFLHFVYEDEVIFSVYIRNMFQIFLGTLNKNPVEATKVNKENVPTTTACHIVVYIINFRLAATVKNKINTTKYKKSVFKQKLFRC